MERLPLADLTHVAGARRRAIEVARGIGMDETGAGRAAIVVTELATNLVRHGGGGEMLLDLAEDGAAVEVIALDRGPGMRHVQECLRDGYSTSGTAGTGLGAVRRQSDLFEIHSGPGAGTAVLARIRARGGAGPKPSPIMAGSVSVPKPGEAACGDGCCRVATAQETELLVADGLGHGPLAAEAAAEAVRLFRKEAPAAPAHLLKVLHAGMRHTRGGAVAVALVDPSQGQVRFAGIGNIAGALVHGGVVRRMVSHNGTAGHTAPRFQEFTYPVTGASVLVMHTDGIASSWSLDRWPGAAALHPTLIAALLYRDHSRGRDDATVVIAKIGAAGTDIFKIGA